MINPYSYNGCKDLFFDIFTEKSPRGVKGVPNIEKWEKHDKTEKIEKVKLELFYTT